MQLPPARHAFFRRAAEACCQCGVLPGAHLAHTVAVASPTPVLGAVALSRCGLPVRRCRAVARRCSTDPVQSSPVFWPPPEWVTTVQSSFLATPRMGDNSQSVSQSSPVQFSGHPPNGSTVLWAAPWALLRCGLPVRRCRTVKSRDSTTAPNTANTLLGMDVDLYNLTRAQNRMTGSLLQAGPDMLCLAHRARLSNAHLTQPVRSVGISVFSLRHHKWCVACCVFDIDSHIGAACHGGQGGGCGAPLEGKVEGGFRMLVMQFCETYCKILNKGRGAQSGRGMHFQMLWASSSTNWPGTAEGTVGEIVTSFSKLTRSQKQEIWQLAASQTL
jgi:hypothetical protein